MFFLQNFLVFHYNINVGIKIDSIGGNKYDKTINNKKFGNN